jgi:hypothetical protein
VCCPAQLEAYSYGQKKSSRSGRLAQVLIKVTISVILLGGGTFAFVSMRQHVLDDLANPPGPPVLVLKNRPAWMSDALAEQILKSAQPKIASDRRWIMSWWPRWADSGTQCLGASR